MKQSGSTVVTTPDVDEAPTPPTPRKWKRLGTTARTDIADRYRRGETSTALAKEYRVAKTTILGILRANNVTIRRQPMTPDQVTDAARLYEAGSSLSEVARKIQVNQETMRLAILKAGVVLRPASRANH